MIGIKWPLTKYTIFIQPEEGQFQNARDNNKGFKTLKCYAYIRVSGKGQVEGDGFNRQIKAIQNYAKANGLTLLRIFREEGVSGTLETRPALAEMMVALEHNDDGVNTVIIEKVDRLARDLMVQEAIINDFQKLRLNLISALEGPDLLKDDPTRKLVRQVLGAIAEYDKTMTVLKLKAARERIRKRGKKCEGRKGYYEVSPDVVERIKALRRKSKNKPRLSCTKIAEIMNQEGYQTITGKIWTRQLVAHVLASKSIN